MLRLRAWFSELPCTRSTCWACSNRHLGPIGRASAGSSGPRGLQGQYSLLPPLFLPISLAFWFVLIICFVFHQNKNASFKNKHFPGISPWSGLTDISLQWFRDRWRVALVTHTPPLLPWFCNAFLLLRYLSHVLHPGGCQLVAAVQMPPALPPIPTRFEN